MPCHLNSEKNLKIFQTELSASVKIDICQYSQLIYSKIFKSFGFLLYLQIEPSICCHNFHAPQYSEDWFSNKLYSLLILSQNLLIFELPATLSKRIICRKLSSSRKFFQYCHAVWRIHHSILYVGHTLRSWSFNELER